jgi:UDP-N-acetyl-D-mannosaminuronate dehydrogenase
MFFRNQEKLKEIRIRKNLQQALRGADAVVFAVRHEPYLTLEPQDVVDAIGKPAAVVDAFGILKDEQITQYIRLGCAVKGMGRGHITRLKEKVMSEKNSGK